MSRLAVTLALAGALAAGACGPPIEPRTTIAGSGGGPRVLFEDELRSPRNWPAAQGSICKSSYADGGYMVENIGASTPCLLGPVRPEAYPAGVRIEVDARQRKGTREGAFGLMFGSRGAADGRTFATFGLTANGTYRVAHWTGKWSYPVPPTASRSVKSDYGAVNHLAVEVRDKSIVAYVNGRPVATAELPADGAGTVGLYVDQRGMEVVFSNLRVVELVPMR
ncbi:MAG TPA: hypothetical protein VN323_10565 [Candidatus Dormibacteraeota bacterium]|nr:hypothetical protein [Candidatus Dormibacteraeota bacterium]